jgi:hypothetical protein
VVFADDAKNERDTPQDLDLVLAAAWGGLDLINETVRAVLKRHASFLFLVPFPLDEQHTVIAFGPAAFVAVPIKIVSNIIFPNHIL